MVVSTATLLVLATAAISLPAPRTGATTACTGAGDPLHDWLVATCPDASTLSTSRAPDGSSRVYSLGNGIVTRELTHNATTGSLSTTAIKMTANHTSENLVASVAPEASLTINGVVVQVGGLPGQVRDSSQAMFSAVRSGGYAWVPGTRGSNPDAPQGEQG